MKMNTKGQFSIIAALLVAVILVGTVISTYSAIRYNNTTDQPQILSAVDETNLALKQLLGFTLGYYGSVLQVTGNTTYAQNITRTYLNSGLENIANTKPELGVSFNVTSIALHVEWYGINSFSFGNLNVTYNLVGLGFYGLKYSPVCKLAVQVLPSVSGQAQLVVSQDENEPLNTLSNENFKFYRYLDSETWGLTNPDSIEEVTLGGTYSIIVPSGIDSTSYFVQVEDVRGIMVVASSFSHYTSTSTWSTTYSSIGDYVDQSSNVDYSDDKGSQTNFELLKVGPDSQFDILTEENYGLFLQKFITELNNVGGDIGIHSDFTLQQSNDGNYDVLAESEAGLVLVNSESFEGSWPPSLPSSWTRTGNWAKETDRSHVGSWSADFDGSGSGDLTTGNLDCSDAAAITIDFWYRDEGCEANEFRLQLWDGSNWDSIDLGSTNPESTWNHYQQRVTDNQYFDSTFRVQWNANSIDNNEHAYVDDVTITKELPVTLVLVNSESFEGSWPPSLPSSWTRTGNWAKETDRSHVGSWSADFDGSGSGDLTTGNLDCSDAAAITIDFWYRDEGCEANEFRLQLWDGSNWDSIDLGSTNPESTWNHYQQRVTDNQYFDSTFRVQWNANSIDNNEHAYVDDVTITKEVPSKSYQLNLEEQFNDVEYGQTNEYLYIYAGDLGSESLYVDVWTGTIWTPIIDALQPYQLNNVSVANYLNNPTFTIRFRGGLENGDRTQDNWQIDCVMLNTWTVNYELDFEDQFTNVDYSQTREWLCIYTGDLDSESLRVDVWSGSNWVNVISSLQPNQWNNVSVSTWLSSSTFIIRFNGSSAIGDTTQDSWNIDAVMLRLDSNYDLFSSLQDSTIVVEWLQNGTMRRMGQNLNLTTTAKPFPPIPVKAIHINQTFVNGTNREVPFQVEDWASNYSIPLGLTNNATVFSNKQMLVYLLDKTVAETTIWWNGSDLANQPPTAYSNVYFTGDDQGNNRLTNGGLTLQFGSGFTLTSTVGGTTSTANFMRINSEPSVYGASAAYVIHHGVARDIVQQEAEWNDGADNCPNLYANIVITLPARTSYYTYQLRFMFLNSQQDRTINDLCPIKITAPYGTVQTEDGVSNGMPIVATGNNAYYNTAYPATPGTAHHWSQCVTGSSGTGIMYTDSANKLLYAFDSFVGSATGAIKATNGSTSAIELLPVTRFPANHYNNALDITWSGAVATFSSATTPIYDANGGNPTGLWILAEYQPTISVATGT